MDGWVGVWVSEWMSGWGWMDVWGWMDGFVVGWMILMPDSDFDVPYRLVRL